MKIVRAEAMGMCFGVRDALEVIDEITRADDVTVYGELVHNEQVLVQLDTRGFRQLSEQGRDIPATKQVLITAHGISDRERQRLQSAGKQLIDTTCPLVTRVHLAARTLQQKGYFILVIGKPGHVEVQGIIEDLEQYEVIPDDKSVRDFRQPKLGIICQSTTPPRQAGELAELIRERNPAAEVRYLDTICQPTRDRQEAVEKLIDAVDTMIVVGGRNSNNTRQLVKLAEERGRTAFHIQTADDLDPAWLEHAETVGLTAGTSTLDDTIEEVYARLQEISALIHADSPGHAPTAAE